MKTIVTLIAVFLAGCDCREAANASYRRTPEETYYRTWAEHCEGRIGAISRLHESTVGIILGPTNDDSSYRQAEDDPHAAFELEKVDLPLGLFVDFEHHDRDGWACFCIYTKALSEGNDALGGLVAKADGFNFHEDCTYVLIQTSAVSFIEKDWSDLPEHF